MRDDSARAQQQLHLFRHLFDHARDATIVADAEGRVQLLNRAAQDLPEDLVERLFVDGGPHGAVLDPFREEMRRSGKARAEVRLDGRALCIEGRSLGAERIIVLRDVTIERRLEAELRAHDRAETGGYLTPSIAPPPGASAEHVDVSDVLLERRALIERVAGEKVEVRIALDGDAGGAILDRALLDQALVYLAANAREAMPAGGRLTVRSANVTLEAGASAGSYVAVTLEDTGAGMSNEARERVFARFLATSEPDGGAAGGPALRLAAVRRFVADSGGFLAVHSRPGCGTAVALYFPRVEEDLVSMVRLHPSPDDETGKRPTGSDAVQTRGRIPA